MKSTILTLTAFFLSFTTVALAQLPDPGMEIDPANTALVITDPQNDFLSPEGVTWGVVGASVESIVCSRRRRRRASRSSSRRTTTTRPITSGSSEAPSKR